MNDAVAIGDRPRITALFWVCYPLVLAWLWWLGFYFFRSSVPAGAGLKMIGIAIGAAIIAPLVWIIADWLRKAAMPDMFFSRGFLDTLTKKAFWAIGPQVIGMLLVCGGSFAAMASLMPDSSSVKPNPSANAKPAALSTASLTPTPTPTPTPTQSTAATPSRPTPVSNAPAPRPTPAAPANSRAAGLCVHPQTLRSLKSDLLGAMTYTAKATSGRDIDVETLRTLVSVGVEDIRALPHDSPTGAVCEGLLSVQVSGELAGDGLESFVEEGVFIVHELADGSLSAGFAD